MAKFGEGDERWLVKDLGESGRNVNNWHWSETDALPWCKARLAELLVGSSLIDSEISSARVVKLQSLTGEAIVNNRKGKTIVLYELEAVLSWEGTGAEGAKLTGELKLPYVSEENHDEAAEVQVTVKETGPEASAVRGLILKQGRPRVQAAVATFVTELRAGGPKLGGDGPGVASPAPGASTDAGADAAPPAASSGNTAAAREARIEQPPPAPATRKPAARDRRRLELNERFYASAADIFDCFTDARRVQAYTGSSAEIEASPGGALSMFGGSVQGKFLELERPTRIVMEWRFSNWADGDVSRVEIDVREPERGNTHLHLLQTGIPETDRFGQHDVLGLTQAGWANQIFHRIRQVFGYGI